MLKDNGVEVVNLAYTKEELAKMVGGQKYA